MSPTEFMKKYGLEGVVVAKRPPDVVNYYKKDWEKEAGYFVVRLKVGYKGEDFDYWVGPGNFAQGSLNPRTMYDLQQWQSQIDREFKRYELDISWVVYSLASDAQCRENARDVADFLAELGYTRDGDSVRRGVKAWSAIGENMEKLRRLVGDSGLRDLMEVQEEE